MSTIHKPKDIHTKKLRDYTIFTQQNARTFICTLLLVLCCARERCVAITYTLYIYIQEKTHTYIQAAESSSSSSSSLVATCVEAKPCAWSCCRWFLPVVSFRFSACALLRRVFNYMASMFGWCCCCRRWCADAGAGCLKCGQNTPAQRAHTTNLRFSFT